MLHLILKNRFVIQLKNTFSVQIRWNEHLSNVDSYSQTQLCLLCFSRTHPLYVHVLIQFSHSLIYVAAGLHSVSPVLHDHPAMRVDDRLIKVIEHQ